MFDGWGPKPYLHSVFNDFAEKAGQYPYLYAYQIAHNSSNITAKYLWDNMVNSWFLGREEEWAAYQFHFNTYKLNEYIANFATENMGINIFDDKIVDVLFYENGYIDKIVGERSTYDYDFYIDATGFSRLLIGKMGASWKSFGQFLKMNSAITFQTPNNEENINVWTKAKAMDAGWMFSIPTWDHQGNGYIYDKNYIDEDSAKKEVETVLGRSVEIGKSFSFDPGHLDKVWINNCVAIGLSGSFVEPLEATSIGSSIQQAFLLSHRLTNYSDKTIDQYNKDFSGIMENIRDFIALHYVVDKGDTQFWIDNKDSEIPHSLGSKLEQWVHKMPIQDDFKEYSDYALFGADNFIMVLEGLEIFNRDSIKKEFYSLSKEQRDDAAQSIQNILLHNSTIKKMTHKKYIEAIREYL
jgi:tryptophan halogenase